ncbi:hypothetical protein BZG01_12590 [Labilibaculum manganireducens]|uniref:Beta-glucuronidase C-terminal domain-containing protein n=1 Tax=Labilibaculum manganireducens TaxID=1940525 RepID=A0A2N3I6R7_9BACT|nr:hypothetical protein [Labilibaculum manganireducens]PKQ65996.1 hypothetical protein BZG01_12590 [Labilibaculum manganireducens]
MKTIYIVTLILIATCLGAFAVDLKTDNSKDPVSPGQTEHIIRLKLRNLKQIAEVNERYQSFNVEMCEVVGGRFWIPYVLLDSTKIRGGGFDALKRKIPAVNLYDKKLRMLTSELGPTYIRVSGTWANSTYFQDNDDSKLVTAPDGYENVLTRKEWKGVIDFCKAVDGKLAASFAISDGMRDKEGNWTPAQVEPLINYTKSIGGEIAVAEMFNEPSHASHGNAPKNYDGNYFDKDFAAFKSFVRSAMPEMIIAGPGSTGEGGIMPGISLTTDQIFAADPKPNFDIWSYHYYGILSKRCFGRQTPENAISKEWLSKTELGLKYYEEFRDKYQPCAPIWLTETAEASCGGNPLSETYLDCFRYLEQLGRLAKKNVQVVMHNTLCASEYGILDQYTLEPRPNYWAALLWNKLMGTKVYDAGVLTDGVDIFAHSLKNSSKGMAVLIVNTKDTEQSIFIPAKAKQYLFSADVFQPKSANELQTKTVKLNGQVLNLNSDGALPNIKGKKVYPGVFKLPPYSFLFLSF